MKYTERIVGDLKITKEEGGNDYHGGFWHFLSGCHVIHSEHETVLCSPSVHYSRTYYSCGFYSKEKTETTREYEHE